MGNSDGKGGYTRGEFGAVKPESSLWGRRDRSMEDEESSELYEDDRRPSSASTIKALADPRAGLYDFGRDEGYSSLSGASLAYQLVLPSITAFHCLSVAWVRTQAVWTSYLSIRMLVYL